MVRVHVTIGAFLKLHVLATDFLGHLGLMALFASHIQVLAGERVSRLGVIEILGGFSVLPIVYVVAFLTVLAKTSLVVVLMFFFNVAGTTEKRASSILSFQEPADLREHVRRRVAL